MEAWMRLLTPLSGVTIALAGVGVPLRAQNADALFAGRHCDQTLAKLRAVAVSDVVDSGPLVAALRKAADSGSPITEVVLTYDAYGQLSRLKTGGIRSPAASADLEREVRAMAKPVTGMPNTFMARIVRLNRRDVIDISPFPLTCPPNESSTPEAARIMRESRRFPSPPPRDAVVQVWLRSSGDVADAWIVRSAGRSELDSLALTVVRVLRYTPPLVGTTPVAISLQVPVHF
jgi:TonB family protein